jgi:valyl-tRNA synthetase
VTEAAIAQVVKNELPRISRLARAKVEVLEKAAQTAANAPAQSATAAAVGTGWELRVSLAGAVDVGAELARISKEISKVDADLAGIEKKLENPNFVAKAPPEVVEKDRARVTELREKRGKLLAHRQMLGGPGGSV